MLGTAYIGLGSNLGDREAFLGGALDELVRRGVEIEAVSRLYETAPVYVLDQPAFLNAAAKIRLASEPVELLALLGEVEQVQGRVRRLRYGPRTVDLDVLLFGERGEVVWTTPELTIPHPRLLERAFALLPLADVASGLVHPLCGRSIGELAESAPGREGVRVVAERWYGT